jgi:Uma2 family endonuclease
VTGMTIQEFVKQYKKESPFEIIDREIQPVKLMVAGHATVLKNLYDPLSQFVKAHDLGEVFYRLPYLILDQDDLVRNARVPDLMFVSKERFEQYKTDRPDWQDAPLLIVPDMPVQIQARYEDFYETDEKVKRYLHDGVEEVWWVHRDVTVVFIEHQSNSVLLRLDDNLISEVFQDFLFLSIRFLKNC